MSDLLASPDPCELGEPSYSLTPIDFPAMMAAFSKMLSRGLAQTAAQITASIYADLQQIGIRIEVIGKKADQSVARINQNSAKIQDLQDQLETAMSKIDDLENRSRCDNFRIQGLPASVKQVQPADHSLIKDLIPDIREHRLELDRAHRALQPLRMDGLPRDIIVKPHFHAVEDEVMKMSHNT